VQFGVIADIKILTLQIRVVIKLVLARPYVKWDTKGRRRMATYCLTQRQFGLAGLASPNGAAVMYFLFWTRLREDGLEGLQNCRKARRGGKDNEVKGEMREVIINTNYTIKKQSRRLN
jgi:hypothetical protein